MGRPSLQKSIVASATFVLLVLASLVMSALPARASTSSATASTFAELKTAFTNSTGADALVTLTSSITEPSDHAAVPAGVTVTLDLNGKTLTITADSGYAALEVPATSTLILKNGTLTATGNGGAAIGGSWTQTSGTVQIESGTYTLTGSTNASAVGGGFRGDGGPIIIHGGTITATTVGGAGFGGGFYHGASDITITGGDITVEGYKAIGGGWSGANGVLHLPTTANAWNVTADFSALSLGRWGPPVPGCACFDDTLTPIAGTDYTVTGTTSNGRADDSRMILHFVFSSAGGSSESGSGAGSRSSTTSSELASTGFVSYWPMGAALLGIGIVLLLMRKRRTR